MAAMKSPAPSAPIVLCDVVDLLAAKAGLVISGDADWLSLGAFEGIAIIAVRETIDRVETRNKT